ncbi:MAG: hypothetical protein ABI758_00500 [Candidatus Woesebacteria bacterium]
MKETKPNPSDFIEEQRLRLRKAILETNADMESRIIADVIEKYGAQYARQWRMVVAEELGQQRIEQSTKEMLKGYSE